MPKSNKETTGGHKRIGVSNASAVPEKTKFVRTVETKKPEELHIFSPISEQTGIIKSGWGCFYPTAPLSNAGPITVEIPGHLKDFTDLQQSYWKVSLKIETSDGKEASPTDKISCVNGFMTSLFSKVSLFANGVRIGDDNCLFHYSSYIIQKLSYGKQAKETLLKHQCVWVPDTGDPTSNDFAENNALVSRKGLLMKGKLIGKLPLDLCLQPRLIPNLVDIRIILERGRDDFCLIKDSSEQKNFRVSIKDMGLYIRRVTLSDGVYNNINSSLASRPAQFPMTKVSCNTLNIPMGTRKFRGRNLFTSEFKPKRIIAGLVKQSVFLGTDTTNPYAFSHHKLVSCTWWDDHSQLILEPYKMDFENGDYMDSYYALLRCMKTVEAGIPIDVDYSEFAKNSCFLAADFDPDSASPSTKGRISIELEFEEALTEVLTLVLVGEFSSCMILNHAREVNFIDF